MLGGVGGHGVDGADTVGQPGVPLDVDVAIDSPARAPRVLHDPVVFSSLLPVADDQHRVVDVVRIVRAVAGVDSLSVP